MIHCDGISQFANAEMVIVGFEKGAWGIRFHVGVRIIPPNGAILQEEIPGPAGIAPHFHYLFPLQFPFGILGNRKAGRVEEVSESR